MNIGKSIQTNVGYVRRVVRSDNPALAKRIEPYLAKIEGFAGRLGTESS